MKIDLNTIILTVLVVLISVSMTVKPNGGKTFGASGFTSTQVAVASTTTTKSVTTSTRIISTSSPSVSGTRMWMDVCNDDASRGVLLRLDGDKAADGRTGGGVWLAAKNCYKINDQNLYTGSITASSSDGAALNVLVNLYEL